jgi:site-specific DNA recombinase
MVTRQNETVLDNTAAIYARFSSHNQREESIDAQVRACTEYAQKKGYHVVGVYADSAKTGTNADRGQFQQMIKDSENRFFKCLIIHKLDRFSRNKYDSAIYKRKLKQNGVAIRSVMENLDDSPESVVLESVLEGFNQYYSLNLARETMKGLKESAYKCQYLGGRPPLGFDIDRLTKKYVINEAEAATVRDIFRKYAEGIGYNQILEYLNGTGVKTKYGNPFGKNSLYSLLQNEKYIGTFIFNKMKGKDVCGTRNPQMKPRDEWIIVENGVPAIVDKDVFNAVQTKLSSNRKKGGKFRAKEIYLLSGLIVCGECGSNMYGNRRLCGRKTSKYVSYKCSNRGNHMGCKNKEIRKDCLDNYVLDELYKQLFSDRSIRKLSKMLTDYNQKKSAETSGELSQAEKEFAEINVKIGKVIQLVSESGVSIDTVKGELKRLEDRKLFMEGYIKDMRMNSNASMISEETIRELLCRSQEFVRTRNIPECRNFIQSYVEKVIVYEGKVEVCFRIHIPDNDGRGVRPIKSEEEIATLREEYKSA